MLVYNQSHTISIYVGSSALTTSTSLQRVTAPANSISSQLWKLDTEERLLHRLDSTSAPSISAVSDVYNDQKFKLLTDAAWASADIYVGEKKACGFAVELTLQRRTICLVR